MLFILFENNILTQIIEDTVGADAREARLAGGIEHALVLALLAADHRRQDLDLGAFIHRENAVGDLIDRLLADLSTALRTMRNADTSVEQTEIVIDLRDRTDRGTRVLGGRFLVDGDRGRQSVDRIHLGLLHLSEEHARVGGQALNIAALTLGVDGIECEGAFARARQTREHH